jgi:DNA repair protein RecO (recombination protein O)
MRQKTKGIVLKYFKYGETSLIARIYTYDFGLQSYIINGVRSSKSKNNKIALFQPLSLLEMVVYTNNKPNQNLHRLTEANILYPYIQIPFDFTKTSLAWLVVEILDATLKEEVENSFLFDFLYESLINLDKKTSLVANFPISFLLQLSSFLGFNPQKGEQIFTQIEEHYQNYFPIEIKEILIKYFDIFLKYEDLFLDIPISIQERRNLLDILLDFYQIHIPNFQTIKSLQIVREISR